MVDTKINIDWTKYFKDLATKANTDGDNFTLVGTDNIAGMGMTGDKFTELTLPQSGSYLVAPADGKFIVGVIKNSSPTGYISIYRTRPEVTSSVWNIPDVLDQAQVGIGDQQGWTVSLECQKGDKCWFNYSNVREHWICIFRYAEGAI